MTPADLRDPMWNLPTPEREWPLDWADRRNRDYRDAAAQPAAAPDGTPVGSFSWHASPDIRLRPMAGGGAVAPPPGLPWNAAPPDLFWLWTLQTSLRTQDPLIVPDGRWTPWWARRLAAIRVALGLDPAPGVARVDADLWNHAVVQAAFWTDPWAEGGPTEADLIERVTGMPTPRVGGAASAATSPATLAAPSRQCHVDVCLHHRGREPVSSANAAVTLLRFQLPPDPPTWAALAPPAPPSGPVLAALHAALDALPAAGGALPAGFGLPAGWVPADPVISVRRPDGPIATCVPGIVTFDVDFSTATAGSRWLLLALAHSTADPVRASGADLREMVLASRHLAARSVEIV
jgi:hypothetical protein